MKEHEIKCWREPFQTIKKGRKSFEYRLDDRNYQVGDSLHLREWDHLTQEYTGESLRRIITYKLGSECFDVPVNYCVLSLL